ncbi:MAG TPA: hypothetical protein PLJ35_05325 [Anaerolineae bacterium]|nr:hypothetical protein [Anaerolineae bacterium]
MPKTDRDAITQIDPRGRGIAQHVRDLGKRKAAAAAEASKPSPAPPAEPAPTPVTKKDGE